MHFKALLSVGALGFSLGTFGHYEQRAIDTTTITNVNAGETKSQHTEQSGPEGITFPNFKPVEFPFVTTIPDDGADKGAGWQAARANLKFTRIVLPLKVIEWYCPFTVGMPLRTERRGVISATQAAIMSAAVANSVVATMDFALPQGIFCHKFVEGMQVTFPIMYVGLGASVQR